MQFQANQRIVFIGDSITDCGRRDAARPYGSGYVQLARSLLAARHPGLGLTILNRGIGGDTVRHLAARWERDVFEERPDWLVVKIGINDVWRAFGERADQAVPLDEYVATYRALLDQAGEAPAPRLILMTPYLIEPDRADPMRAAMDAYGAAVAAIARDYGALLVDTQAAFDHALQVSSPADWADDRIHPSQPGHALLALALLRAIGFALT